MRQLASIQTIDRLDPIENADATLETAEQTIWHGPGVESKLVLPMVAQMPSTTMVFACMRAGRYSKI